MQHTFESSLGNPALLAIFSMMSIESAATVLVRDVRARAVDSGSKFIRIGTGPAAVARLARINGPHGTGVADGFTINAS